MNEEDVQRVGILNQTACVFVTPDPWVALFVLDDGQIMASQIIGWAAFEQDGDVWAKPIDSDVFGEASSEDTLNRFMVLPLCEVPEELRPRPLPIERIRELAAKKLAEIELRRARRSGKPAA